MKVEMQSLLKIKNNYYSNNSSEIKFEYEKSNKYVNHFPKEAVPYKNKIVKGLNPILCDMVIIQGSEYWRGSSLQELVMKNRHKNYRRLIRIRYTSSYK